MPTIDDVNASLAVLTATYSHQVFHLELDRDMKQSTGCVPHTEDFWRMVAQHPATVSDLKSYILHLVQQQTDEAAQALADVFLGNSHESLREAALNALAGMRCRRARKILSRKASLFSFSNAHDRALARKLVKLAGDSWKFTDRHLDCLSKHVGNLPVRPQSKMLQELRAKLTQLVESAVRSNVSVVGLDQHHSHGLTMLLYHILSKLNDLELYVVATSDLFDPTIDGNRLWFSSATLYQMEQALKEDNQSPSRMFDQFAQAKLVEAVVRHLFPLQIPAMQRLLDAAEAGSATQQQSSRERVARYFRNMECVSGLGPLMSEFVVRYMTATMMVKVLPESQATEVNPQDNIAAFLLAHRKIARFQDDSHSHRMADVLQRFSTAYDAWQGAQDGHREGFDLMYWYQITRENSRFNYIKEVLYDISEGHLDSARRKLEKERNQGTTSTGIPYITHEDYDFFDQILKSCESQYVGRTSTEENLKRDLHADFALTMELFSKSLDGDHQRHGFDQLTNVPVPQVSQPEPETSASSHPYGLSSANPVLCGGGLTGGGLDYVKRLRCPAGHSGIYTSKGLQKATDDSFLSIPGVQLFPGEPDTIQRIEAITKGTAYVYAYEITCECGKHLFTVYLDAFHIGPDNATKCIELEGWTLQ